MKAFANPAKLALGLLCVLAAGRLQAQGPPYQTDDPVPVDLHHYEFYIFGAVDGTPVEIGAAGPAFEFNWGAIPRVQLHAILPWGVVAPLNSPVYAPVGQGPDVFGLTDMELGAKIACIKESKHFPQIGSFTMFEMPTGNFDKGLGVGKVWYKLPIWLQKNSGKWLFDGGGGYQVVPQTGYRNFPYTGWLIKRELERAVGAGRRGLCAWPRRLCRRADAGFHHDRRRRLLPLQAQHQRAISFLLRPLGRRANRELRLRGHVLDVGQGREERRARRQERLIGQCALSHCLRTETGFDSTARMPARDAERMV